MREAKHLGPTRWTVRCLSCLVGLLSAAALSGCAPTIGSPNPSLLRQMESKGEFGAPQAVRLCALLDLGVSRQAAQALVDRAWNDTEAGPLGLRMRLASFDLWVGDLHDADVDFAEIQKRALTPECDRLIVFLGHSDERMSRMAGSVSLHHAIVLASPESMQTSTMTPVDVVRHELYHLVGCGHARVMDECYHRIALAKARRKGPDAFFPVYLYLLDEDLEKYCGENALIDDRAEANRIARLWVAQRQRQAAGEVVKNPACTPVTRSR